MPILKLHLENVGPFDALELDFTKPDGSAHLGPHILTGVNGSGKTTVLKAIAWCLAGGSDWGGFDMNRWTEFLAGRTESKAALVAKGSNQMTAFLAHPVLKDPEDPIEQQAKIEAAEEWSRSKNAISNLESGLDFQVAPWHRPKKVAESVGCVATYVPSPVLQKLTDPPNRKALSNRGNPLAFGGTVSNDATQAFWMDSLTKEVRGRPETANRLRDAVTTVLGEEATLTVDLESTFVGAALTYRGTTLNFSQLPAGFSATIGWVVDYLLRREEFQWPESLKDARPGLLLIDEIDVHLHPQWQRRILNGIRAAFPNTQIIVTTHSPFVVTSCEEARVHVFKVDKHGKASLAETIDRPDGTSVDATIHGVFGIKGRFGPEVEDLLTEWNELKKRDHFGKLNAKEKSRLRSLVKKIASRGEELAAMVHEPVISDELLEELLSATGPTPKRR